MNRHTQGSVYLYTLFFVVSLFAVLMLLLQVTLNNATPVYTNAHTVGMYHAGRSAVDLFVYTWPPAEGTDAQTFTFDDYQVITVFNAPQLTATVTSPHTAQSLRLHAVIEWVGDKPYVRNIYQPLQ